MLAETTKTPVKHFGKDIGTKSETRRDFVLGIFNWPELWIEVIILVLVYVHAFIRLNFIVRSVRHSIHTLKIHVHSQA